EKRIPPGQSTRLVCGEVFRVAATGNAVCAYLAVEGGFDVPTILGSAATYTRGRIGGVDGRRLQQRDQLPLKLDSVKSRTESSLTRRLDLALDQPIRVILGPQQDYFAPEAVQTLLSSEYAVSAQSDRMGFRLTG